MLLFLVLAGVLAVMLLFPQTPMARALHRLLVETAVRRLARIRPGHIVFAAILAGVGLILFTLFEIEGLRLFAFMAPDLLVWFSLFDVAVFLDVFAFTVALAATTRWRMVRDQMTDRLTQVAKVVRRGGRAAARERRRREPPTSRPAQSDDPDPAWAGLAQSLVFG